MLEKISYQIQLTKPNKALHEEGNTKGEENRTEPSLLGRQQHDRSDRLYLL